MKNKFRKYSAENARHAWLFLLPALLIIGVFSVYPLFRAFIMSFQKGTMNNLVSAGLDNYKFVIKDPRFHTSLKNTALYAFTVVPISLIISIVISLIVFEKIKFKHFFETLFFIPYLTSTIAIGVVFRYLFNSDYGIINYVLSFWGIGPVHFLTDMNLSMFTVILFGIWNGLAFNIIILLSALRNIPRDYYKVADMFGATGSEQFFKITLPQLVPTLTFLLTVNLIGAFKVYSQVFALFNGKAGLGNSATTAVFYIYNRFHGENRYGIAMAATMILFVIILLVTFLQNKIIKKVEGE
ncbi:MAG TPA: sugar ABC transporter permease [Erysipelothrix sp.]